MKTSNPFIDSMIDMQTQSISNWMESAQKFQKAFTGGSIVSDGQNIYKDWFEKQMNLMGGLQANFNHNGESKNKPEEFFKNWYTQQMEQSKKFMDFNQSIYNSFVNFGKNPNDYIANFSNMNATWTSIYNNWMQTLNHTYETFVKNMPSQFNADAFKNLFESNRTYFKMQEFFQPAFKAFQSGEFSMDNFKNYYNPDTYKQLSEQMFGNIFNSASMKEVFDNSIKNIQEFFGSQNNLAKEYVDQMHNLSKQYPQLISGDFAKLSEMYSQVSNIFGKTFEPLMKLAAPGKEKEIIEQNIALMDKVSEYSVKLAELQYHFYNTSQKAMETSAKSAFEKFNANTTEVQGFTEFYNEWVKVNENLFTELFSSDEFSKLKGEVMNLSMDVKSHFEKLFEGSFNIYPIVFRTEVDELTKTVHDLKKHIKNLETRLAAMGAANIELDEEEKATKRKK